ncbi:hydrolase [Patescibacteria group bacterium]|nr:hydrolase [Patescibacteria group bacterium]
METRIERSNTALVVIDLQKGIVGMPTAPHAAPDVVANAAKLADACRALGIPVFLVRVATSPDGKDRLSPAVDGDGGWGRMQLPADWSEIVPAMGPKPGDFVVTKRQWGAFYGTELDLELRRRGIRTIILCGIATTIGVESTARFAYEYGYDQIFIEDASSDRDADGHARAFATTFPRMGRVRATADILAALGR